MILDVKKKRRLFILFSVLIVFILGFILVDNILYKPTKLNSFIASKVYKTPANKSFTDDNFYKCVVDAYNETNNTSVAYTTNLTDEQLETITTLRCKNFSQSNDEKIKSVKGIEKLTELTHLEASNNQLTELDVSNNPKLTYLSASNNQLTELDVSNNSELTYIDLDDNQLSTIDILNNIKLITLRARYNPIEIIDLSNNINIVSLTLGSTNQSKVLQSINLKNNIKLETLSLYGTGKITNLDLSNNIKLKTLSIQGSNYITSLELKNNKELSSVILHSTKLQNLDLSSLAIQNADISNNTNLVYLDLSNNPLSNLNIFSFEGKSVLSQLKISNCKLKTLDISSEIVLQKLYAYSNQLQELDVSKNIQLETLSISENQLTELNVSGNSNLKILDISNNPISEINLNNNNLLEILNIGETNIQELDLNNNNLLEILNIGETNIQELDLNNNIELIELYMICSKIETLNLNNNTNLKKLAVANGNLQYLDIGNNKELNYLNLYNNNFSSNLVVYVDKLYKIPKNIKNLIFPIETKIAILDVSDKRNSAQLNSNIMVENDNISFNKAGDYSIYVSYSHNLNNTTYVSSSEIFHITYNVKVIETESDKYEINAEAGYIYTKTDTDANTILSNISLNYGEGKIENNKYNIYYEDELIKSFDIVNVSSEVYKITDDYIYYENGDMLMSNIKVTNATMTTIDNSSHDYKMLIKYNDIVVDELDYVTYYSREYDLTKDYIFGDVNLDLIDTTNLIKEITNNKLVIRYNDEIFKSIDIVKIESDYYLIDNYIYIGSDTFDINKVDVINGNKELKENKLIVKYNNDLLKEYLFKSINFGTLENSNKNIIITEDISYEKFVSNITLSEGLSYKIFNGKTEVTSGNISKGMNLKVYYEEEVIDEYEITDEYLEFDSLLKVDDSKNFISNISLESNVDSLLSKINTSGKVIIKDNKGNAIAGNSLVGTGYKIVVELTNETYEYTVIVKGDVTGTGTSSISDVAKLYQYLKKKIDMEECYREAGNVVNIDNEIKINDVAKLYQFIKKKINSLED